MWNSWDLPTTAKIDNITYEIRSDYRDILNIFEVFNDADLLDEEKIYCALEIFYKGNIPKNQDKAYEVLTLFINGNQQEEETIDEKPIMDWEQDLPIIIPPINKALGQEIRQLDYLHWWTFLSAFMEIDECTFTTYVGIRDKLNHGKKLEKYEKEIYQKNTKAINIKKKYDSTTQDLLDDILGI